MVSIKVDMAHGVYKNKESENHSVLKQKKVKVVNLCTNDEVNHPNNR